MPNPSCAISKRWLPVGSPDLLIGAKERQQAGDAHHTCLHTCVYTPGAYISPRDWNQTVAEWREAAALLSRIKSQKRWSVGMVLFAQQCQSVSWPKISWTYKPARDQHGCVSTTTVCVVSCRVRSIALAKTSSIALQEPAYARKLANAGLCWIFQQVKAPSVWVLNHCFTQCYSWAQVTADMLISDREIHPMFANIMLLVTDCHPTPTPPSLVPIVPVLSRPDWLITLCYAKLNLSLSSFSRCASTDIIEVFDRVPGRQGRIWVTPWMDMATLFLWRTRPENRIVFVPFQMQRIAIEWDCLEQKSWGSLFKTASCHPSANPDSLSQMLQY